jgi:RNA polymerase sigma-70 factor (ECF subfamily)
MAAPSRQIEGLRPRLFGIAYRMLGLRQEAEDAVQEAMLRWYGADTVEIRSPEAWLTTVVSRICLDRLRVLAAEREAYIGPWLPEPLVGEAPSPERQVELASDLSLALLMVLERLSPEERAAFLMHDTFDCGYPEISRVLGKSEAACRQIVHRARERIRRDRPRFEVSEDAHRQLVERCVRAVQSRDAGQIASLLAPEAVFISDGGGKMWAARRPVVGRDRIIRLELGVLRKLTGQFTLQLAEVNGRAGALAVLDGRPFAVTSFETNGTQILSVMRVLNPDKLCGLGRGSESKPRPATP